ncbi:hypothetical protein G7046_g7832 [Stylonectria norvegica]|nr:hypothetical protein G7046_g7832 [Stylonectria norvegica]
MGEKRPSSTGQETNSETAPSMFKPNIKQHEAQNNADPKLPSHATHSKSFATRGTWKNEKEERSMVAGRRPVSARWTGVVVDSWVAAALRNRDPTQGQARGLTWGPVRRSAWDLQLGGGALSSFGHVLSSSFGEGEVGDDGRRKPTSLWC